MINVGGFNIGEFSEKSPIANINSSPINRLVRYALQRSRDHPHPQKGDTNNILVHREITSIDNTYTLVSHAVAVIIALVAVVTAAMSFNNIMCTETWYV